MGSNLRRAKISKLELGPGVEDKQPAEHVHRRPGFSISVARSMNSNPVPSQTDQKRTDQTDRTGPDQAGPE